MKNALTLVFLCVLLVSSAAAQTDIPDKFIVCASTTDSPFIFEQDKDKSHRVTCSKPFEFGAADDCRKVDIEFN